MNISAPCVGGLALVRRPLSLLREGRGMHHANAVSPAGRKFIHSTSAWLLVWVRAAGGYAKEQEQIEGLLLQLLLVM